MHLTLPIRIEQEYETTTKYREGSEIKRDIRNCTVLYDSEDKPIIDTNGFVNMNLLSELVQKINTKR